MANFTAHPLSLATQRLTSRDCLARFDRAGWQARGLLALALWLVGLHALTALHADPPDAVTQRRSVTADGALLAAKAFPQAAARILPSIVTIETFGGVSSGARRGRIQGISQAGVGPTTGLIISADGYIVTSTFNFTHQPPIVTVILQDGQRHVAKLLGRDESRRICLLKIKDVRDLPVPSHVPPAQVRIGQWAISVGVGYGDFEPAISAGIVSALGRAWGRAIQTDANISPANYGGPLLDIDGNVIGICVPLHPQSDQQVAGVEWYDSGIGFAIPLSGLDEVIREMQAGKILRRAGLNIKLKTTAEPHVTVDKVPENSSASKAGLTSGDRILAVDAIPIAGPLDLPRILSRYLAGQTVTITTTRAGEQRELRVKLEAAALPSPKARVRP